MSKANYKTIDRRMKKNLIQNQNKTKKRINDYDHIVCNYKFYVRCFV